MKYHISFVNRKIIKKTVKLNINFYIENVKRLFSDHDLLQCPNTVCFEFCIVAYDMQINSNRNCGSFTVLPSTNGTPMLKKLSVWFTFFQMLIVALYNSWPVLSSIIVSELIFKPNLFSGGYGIGSGFQRRKKKI